MKGDTMYFEAVYDDKLGYNTYYRTKKHHSSCDAIRELCHHLGLSFSDDTFDTSIKFALFLQRIQLVVLFNTGNGFIVPLKEKHLQILEKLSGP